jgi:MacB-like periplasmic core domain
LIFVFLLGGAGCERFSSKPAYPAPATGSYELKYVTAIIDGVPSRVACALVQPAFFPSVAVQPSMGRSFISEEYRDSSPTVLLSYNCWQREFKRDPTWIGTSLKLDDRAVTIIGVLPKDFDIPAGVDFWIPRAKSSLEKGGKDGSVSR